MTIRGAIEDVARFHDAAGIVERGDHQPALVRGATRWRLLDEEIRELIEAMADNDMESVADAYADIIYIVLGSALMQIGKERFIRVWDEVQRANMAKCIDGRLVMRDDGKILKPDGWTPPDIGGALR
jgi:predicted HAD superfamily Cof-like phosphohydrolase